MWTNSNIFADSKALGSQCEYPRTNVGYLITHLPALYFFREQHHFKTKGQQQHGAIATAASKCTLTRAKISAECRILALHACTKVPRFNLKYSIDHTLLTLWACKLQSILNSRFSACILEAFR